MRIGLVWECPEAPTSYGKLALWLTAELQRLGFDVINYCPGFPATNLFTKRLSHVPACPFKEVCPELVKPLVIASDAYACFDEDIDVWLIAGTPFGGEEAKWLATCSRDKRPVALYAVTETAVVPPRLAVPVLYADAVAFTTEAVARAFLAHDFVKQFIDRYIVAPNGIPRQYLELDRDWIRSVVASASPSLAPIADAYKQFSIVGFVGKNHPRKDIPALLATFASVKTLRPNTKLLLVATSNVGGDAWDVEALLHSLGLGAEDLVPVPSFFTKMGLAEIELLFIYSSMHVLAFPTFGEGFGLVPVEAAALGTVPVFTETPVTKEIWGEYPLLVKSRPVLFSDGWVLFATDYIDLRNKMLEALDNREKYVDVAKAVAAKFTADAMAKRIAELIDLAIERQGTKIPHPIDSKTLEEWLKPSKSQRLAVLKALNLL